MRGSLFYIDQKEKRKPVFQSKYIGMRELFTMVSGTNSGYGVKLVLWRNSEHFLPAHNAYARVIN